MRDGTGGLTMADEGSFDAIGGALAYEQFVQNKLAEGRVMFLRQPDGTFIEVPPPDSGDGLDPAVNPDDLEPKGPKVVSAARSLEPEDPWPDGDLRSNVA
jgi:hypothetical protein